MILSGYSSLILEMRRVPIPDPVPPPREWVSWNPCKWINREQRELEIAQEACSSACSDLRIINQIGQEILDRRQMLILIPMMKIKCLDDEDFKLTIFRGLRKAGPKIFICYMKDLHS